MPKNRKLPKKKSYRNLWWMLRRTTQNFCKILAKFYAVYYFGSAILCINHSKMLAFKLQFLVMPKIDMKKMQKIYDHKKLQFLLNSYGFMNIALMIF